MGGDADVWIFGVRYVDETIDVVGEYIVWRAVKKRTNENRITKLFLGAGESD